jgi:hypothetical protein
VGESKFSFEKVLEWAKWGKEQGGKIDPYAVATARWRDGTAGAQVEEFLARTPEVIIAEQAEPSAERKLFYGEAAAYRAGNCRMPPEAPRAAIDELPVDADVRQRLYEHFGLEPDDGHMQQLGGKQTVDPRLLARFEEPVKRAIFELKQANDLAVAIQPGVPVTSPLNSARRSLHKCVEKFEEVKRERR